MAAILSGQTLIIELILLEEEWPIQAMSGKCETDGVFNLLTRFDSESMVCSV